MPACYDCGREFETARGLRMHQEAKGHGAFAEPVHEFAHTHRDPFPGACGEWVPRDQFNGTKSFGMFRCSGCRKPWMSAHAFLDFKQGCKDCNLEVLPCCMWESEQSDEREDEREEGASDGPHDTERCEAGRRGVCTACRRVMSEDDWE